MSTNVYRQTIVISSEDLKEINKYLNAKRKANFLEAGRTISRTAIFSDGFEVDVKCCGSYDAAAWTEAVLFDSTGSEVCCSDVGDSFAGEWTLEHKGRTYIVNVIESNVIMKDGFFQTFLLPDNELRKMNEFLRNHSDIIPAKDVKDFSASFHTSFPDGSTVTIGCFGQDNGRVQAKAIWKSGQTDEERIICNHYIAGFWCFDVNGTLYAVFVTPYMLDTNSICSKTITLKEDDRDSHICRYGKVFWKMENGVYFHAELYIEEPDSKDDIPSNAYLVYPSMTECLPVSAIRECQIKFNCFEKRTKKSILQRSYEAILPKKLLFPHIFHLYAKE